MWRLLLRVLGIRYPAIYTTFYSKSFSEEKIRKEKILKKSRCTAAIKLSIQVSQGSVATVSYTHLTLPTNREV